jgi:hypothetical protein
MIAEDGADYGTAKRKAAKMILGSQKIPGDVLPDNAEIEAEVREYQALFFGEEHAEHLHHLRSIALEMMEKLRDFSPYLTGAVLNGSASEHSDIHIQLFAESSKDVAVFLLNQGLNYDVSEANHFLHAGRSLEILSLLWKGEAVHLTLYEQDDQRQIAKSAGNRKIEKADLNAVRALIKENSTE